MTEHVQRWVVDLASIDVGYPAELALITSEKDKLARVRKFELLYQKAEKPVMEVIAGCRAEGLPVEVKFCRVSHLTMSIDAPQSVIAKIAATGASVRTERRYDLELAPSAPLGTQPAKVAPFAL